MVDEVRVERLLRSLSVDDEIVVARLGDLSELEAFVTATARWLEGQHSDFGM